MGRYEDLKFQNQIDSFFIDKWCAKNVRKVSFCSECIHYEECKKKGGSVSPRAIEHKKNAPKGSFLEEFYYKKD